MKTSLCPIQCDILVPYFWLPWLFCMHLKLFMDAVVEKYVWGIVLWKSRTQNTAYVIISVSSGHLGTCIATRRKWVKICSSPFCDSLGPAVAPGPWGTFSKCLLKGVGLPWQLGAGLCCLQAQHCQDGKADLGVRTQESWAHATWLWEGRWGEGCRIYGLKEMEALVTSFLSV